MKRSELTFSRERLTQQLARELMPLLQAHRDEISVFDDVQLEPNWQAYLEMDSAGILNAFTARNQTGGLVGYAVFVVFRHLHYQLLLATQDILYLAPSARRGLAAKWLIEFSERELRKAGVDVITQHVKKRHDFSPLLARMGYSAMETVWFKRLRGE